MHTKPDNLAKVLVMNKRSFFLFYFFCIALLGRAPSDITWAKAPETAKIVFASNRNGNLDIYLMNPDGSDVIQLTEHLSGDYDPVFSPTGEHILFVSHRDGIRDLYLMDTNGRNVKRVFTRAADRSQPAWAPDGKKIVYFRYHDQAIYTAGIDGKNETPLALAGEFGGQPAWSPDGERIVFSFGPAAEGHKIPPDGYPLIFISPQGGNRRKVSLGDIRHTGPSWSPDGEWIAFADFPWFLHERDQGTIHMMKPNGTERKQIVPKAGGYARDPKWSPDSTHLLYEKNVNGELQIFTVNVHSRVTKPLTNSRRNVLGSWFDPAALPVHPQAYLLTTVWGKLKQQ